MTPLPISHAILQHGLVDRKS